MLTIRGHQMRAFRRAQAVTLSRKLVDFIRSNHRHECEEAVLVDRVANVVERGIELGLMIESSYLAYCLLSLRLGDRFDEHPAIAAVLNDRATSPDHRIARLAEEISAEQWEAAALLSRRSAPLRKAAGNVER